MSPPWLILAFTLSLAGCASAPTSEFDPIDDSTAARLRSASSFRVEVLSGKELTHFTNMETAIVSSAILFGAIGAAIAMGAARTSAEVRGEKLARQDGIVDPAQGIAAKLRAHMQGRGRALSDDADLRLYISTTHLSLNKKSVEYFASLYVTSSSLDKNLAQGECRYSRDLAAAGISVDGLLANSSAALKQEFDRAADYCAGYFADKVFPAAL